jgi:hypothetical protein
MEASQMAAYVQLICLTIVSINTSLDPGGPSQAPAWQLALPLLSLRLTVRDVFELMVIGRSNDRVPLLSGKDAVDSPLQPKSNVAIKALNLAAVLACYISLQDQESNAMYMKLLVANNMCCWITGKFNTTIRRRRRDIDQDQDPLPWQSEPAIDITTTFISHSTLFMLMISESFPETLLARALRSTVWFLPLAATAITLSIIPDSHQGRTNAPPKIPPGFLRMQMCCWLSIAAFVGFGDLTRIIVRREPVGFGGLHPLHAGAVGAHYFAAMVMMLVGEEGDTTVDGNGSWVLDAGIAGVWLGLVGFNTLYVPKIDTGRSGCKCRLFRITYIAQHPPTLCCK